MTDEEAKQLIAAFNKLKLKPKADTAEDLAAWMEDIVHSKVKTDPDPHGPASASKSPAVQSHVPRISFFTGEPPKNATESTYDLWKYEVKCLMSDKVYPHNAVTNAVRRSLRGEAGQIAKRLGPLVEVHEILEKLESVYGAIDTKETLLSKFYSARQREDEDVSSWGCRLEDILDKAVELGDIKPSQANEMLRNMFWTGLKKSLKDVSGHKFDSVTDFDQLRVAIRRIEQDQKCQFECSTKKPQTAKMTSTSVEQNDITEIKGMIKQLSAEVHTLKQKDKQLDASGIKQYAQSPFHRGSTSGDRHYNYSDNTINSHGYRNTQSGRFAGASRDNTVPVCWRCGQHGHLQRGCRVILDHSKQGLNRKRPMEGGRP